MNLFEKIMFGIIGVCTAFLTLLLLLGVGHAQTPAPLDIPCPNDEPCQVLVLTKTELNVLTGDNGILATAAQARSLDLGMYVSYFRQKIALAPAGKNAAKPIGEPEKLGEPAKK